MLKKFVSIGMLAAIMAGCSTLDSGSSRTNTPPTQEETDVGRALEARGFYKTDWGNINYQSTPACGGYELQSHRGSVRFPENSINAVVDSLDNNFDVVEIDVRVTRDGVWVLHHDDRTGRESGTIDNKRRKISSVNYEREWGYLRARDQNTGELLNQLPPEFLQVAKAFKKHSATDQKLNIEIKAKTNAKHLKMLDYIAFSALGEGKYFYSSLSLRTLENMRDINPSVYLSFIQSPTKRSVSILRKSLQNGVKDDFVYQDNQAKIDNIVGIGTRHYREKRYDSHKGMQSLKKALKRNFGYAVDIRRYAPEPGRIKNLASRYGATVSTYTINGHQYHADLLKKLGRSVKPDSVIIDDTLYGFCSRYSLPPIRPYQALTEKGRLIASLPIDLDLERLEEISTYHENGLYPRINGQIGSVTEAVDNPSRNTTNPYKAVFISTDAGPKMSGDKAELHVEDAIQIEVRR